MITSFSDFWNLLEKENPIWWEQVNMRFFKKDIKKCAQDCHVYILADEKLFKQLTECDGAALRKYFTSWLMKAPDAPVAPQLQQVEHEPVYQGPPPLTGEEREKRIQEWKAAVLAVDNNFRVPNVTRKEAEEEGQWDRPKQTPYNPPSTYITLVNENIKKFAAKKYKGLRYIDGFKRFGFGEVSVLAENEQDAKEIIKKAERLAKLQMTKI